VSDFSARSRGRRMEDRPSLTDAVQPRRFVSPLEFSQLSGLSLATVHRYLKKGKLPSVQPSGRRGRILIPADALERCGNTTLEAAHPEQTTLPTAKPGAAPSPRPSGPRPRWTRTLNTSHTEDT
jgi:hypothetical protein